MNIKLPPSYDVSHHKEIPDFQKVEPKPLLFITKATEDIVFVDSKFVRFAEGMMKIEVIRGFYHFHRKAYNPYKQAEHFLNIISRIDILSTDFLILDVEEGGERAAQLWAWFETVRNAYPDNRLLLYGRKNLLDPIYMTSGEKEYFKKIPVWPAGYPYYPDLFSKIPSGYIPDQTKYGKPVLWQYSSHGRVDGIVTELGRPTDVDLNWIDPEFSLTLGSNAVEGVTMALYEGVCINGSNKVWNSVGGQQIGSVREDDPIRADQEFIQAGTKYLHLTSPLVGYTKAQWYSYHLVTEPEPEPEPEPPDVTKTHTIDVFSDGNISIDGIPY